MDNGFQLLLVIVVGFTSCYIGLFLHECGHLFAALLVGWQPLTFRVGNGRELAAFRRGDLHVKLGWWPGTGLVTATAKTTAWYRLKWFVFVMAGPLVNFAIAWGIWQVVKQAEFFSQVPPLAYNLLLVVLATQALILFGTTCPHTTRLYDRERVSDGLQIWRCLTMSAQKIAERANANRAARISVYLERGEEDRAWKAFKEISAQEGWELLTMRTVWIHWLLHHGKRAEADAAMETLRGEADTLGIPRSHVLDSLACIPLFYGHTHLRGRALDYIEEAILEDPSAITLKGTKGSLLVEEGKYEEGRQLLREVMAQTTAENDRAICSYYIALATRETDSWQEGRQLLERAIKEYPTCVVRPRVYRLFWNEPR